MAYSEHYLLQFGGTLGSALQEIWTCGIRMETQNTPVNLLDESEYLEGTAAGALEEWFTRQSSQIAGATFLRWAKFNRIATSGAYLHDDYTNVYDYPTPIPGAGGTGSVLPFQCAVVLSWHTNAASRGPGSRGRIYSPHPAIVVNPDTGQFSDSIALSMAESAAELLNNIDDSVGPFGQIRPVIASGVNGALNEINGVSVDTVVDTVRTRRNALTGVRRRVDFDY